MVYKIKSEFIKKKIKKLDYKKNKHREYVKNMFFLEKGITECVHGFGEGYKFGSLSKSYEKEYEELLKELKPKDYKIYLKEKEKQRIEDEKLDKEIEDIEKEEEAEEKGWWRIK